MTGGLDGDPATTGGLVFIASNSGRILTDGIDFGAQLSARSRLRQAEPRASTATGRIARSSRRPCAGSVIPPGYPGAGTAVPASAPRECVGLYSANCGSPGSAGPNLGAWLAPAGVHLAAAHHPDLRRRRRFADVAPHLEHAGRAGGRRLRRHASGPRTANVGTLDGQTVDFGHIPAYNYFDLATRFSINDHLDITITVQNLFNKQPPIVGSTIGSTSFNSGNTYPSTYDALGRRYAVSARLRFWGPDRRFAHGPGRSATTRSLMPTEGLVASRRSRVGRRSIMRDLWCGNRARRVRLTEPRPSGTALMSATEKPYWPRRTAGSMKLRVARIFFDFAQPGRSAVQPSTFLLNSHLPSANYRRPA